ncbi:acyl-CoA dehydrogenase family protein [Gulosibacter molinativorax]|uniref:Acyl-CoA dehydrogenase n=1 Tax=Gulosibacter molinativorax TaxID=256821 RepID=A0ABT7CCG1_9MICO|nr:acyl-CoA dehydrogenase family protein [Gulosibacter molinativorax]MDJ1372479.1 acyl-CoA dehydrogenase [Gulosibacter molinativorax]QUY61944.1 Putative glutaryl-CoA dehydrogenase [Gulosibacter molinativorax]
MLAGLDTDYYNYWDDFSVEEQERLTELRSLLEREAKPRVNDLWAKEEFPFDLVTPLAELGIFGMLFDESKRFESSARFRGWVTLELARVDASLATFFGVHVGLGMNSIGILGSPEQRAEWLPKMARGEVIGACGITEPLSGSDTAKGIQATARRDGDDWILNGQKRWIGNATWSDITIIYARDVEDGQVKGFIVPTDTEGYKAEKIVNKQSLRIVQNADITLTDVVVPESLRLANCNSFRDVSRVLRHTRSENGWIATGLQMGAVELAREYALEREQFGRPIASFQLVQDLLVKSLSNVTSSLALLERLATVTDRGEHIDEMASLSKAYTSVRARETVSWCRELFGGNGIDLNYSISRFFCDAEAVHTYEGTREMNTLIVGRDFTGIAAFV